jgi:CBS-domain-containing membrane protein
MTTDVVTTGTTTSYKQVARIMAEQKVNAVPIITKDRHVVGIVSEADGSGEGAASGGSARLPWRTRRGKRRRRVPRPG